jgi:spore coat protein CotH
MRAAISCVLLLPLFLSAQNTDGDWLFGSNTLHTVEFTFDDPNYWDSLTVNYELDRDFPAHLSVDGVPYQIVGVQFKGNSSYNGPSDKKPFKVDVNAYYVDQRIDGEKKFVLNNCFKDPSFLREKLYLDFLNANGVNAPRCTYAKVYLNGSYWGLYTMVEAVDKVLLQHRFDDDEGNLFKGDPSGDLRWYGDQASDYTPDHFELHTNEDLNNWSGLIHAIDLINNTSDALLADSIHARFKTQRLLRAWAADNLFANLDSYLGSGHNYYLYHDSSSTLEWNWITWDVNEAFGNFQQGLSLSELENLPIDHVGGPPGGRPLYQRILENTELRAEYQDQMCDLVMNAVDTVWFREHADSLAAVISEAVQSDTHKFYTDAEFVQNRNANVTQGQWTFPGVLSFLRTRVNYMSGVLNNLGCFMAVDETADVHLVNVYPTPASDVLRFDGATNAVQARAYDPSGRLVIERDARTGTIDVSTLNNGPYVLELIARDRSVIWRGPVMIAR